MNQIYLSVAIFLIVILIYYYCRNAISRMIPYKNSIVFTEEKDDCVLVPVYVTRYALGWRAGIDVSVDGILAANIKPGNTILVPMVRGVRRISSQCYNIEKYEIDINIDADKILFIDADYEKLGGFATPFVKELKKNSLIDESRTKEGYQEMLRFLRPDISVLIKFLIVVTPILIIGLFAP